MPLPSFWILAFFFAAPSSVAGGPWCFKCDGVSKGAALCPGVIACGDHESCYVNKHTNNQGADVYTAGCKSKVDCPNPGTVACTECCDTTMCSEKLCSGITPSQSSNGTRLWCAKCDMQTDPMSCDKVDLCSADEQCSVEKATRFGTTVYTMGCKSKSVCTGKTLAANNLLCCATNLCNTNKLGQSPDTYTPPPPTTTTPRPSAAKASINTTAIDFVSSHQSNETLQITCLVGGFPEPNVTWYFVPDVTSSSGNSGNASGVNGTGPASNGGCQLASTPASNAPSVAATGTSPASPSGPSNSSAGSSSNSSASGNVTSGAGGSPTSPPLSVNGSTTSGGSGAVLTSTMTTIAVSTTPAPPGQEITSGVTTSGGISTLQITSPNTSVAGSYICHAENPQGTAEDVVNVTFAALPLINGSLNETVTGDVKDDVILECDVSGEPKPDVHWIFPPGVGGVEKLANGSLVLHNVHADSAGQFTCVANNSVGTVNKSFDVTVTDNSTSQCTTSSSSSMATTSSTTTPAAATTTTATTTTPTTTSTDSTTTPAASTVTKSTKPPPTCPPPVTCPPQVTCPQLTTPSPLTCPPTQTCPPPVTCPVVTCPTTPIPTTAPTTTAPNTTVSTTPTTTSPTTTSTTATTTPPPTTTIATTTPSTPKPTTTQASTLATTQPSTLLTTLSSSSANSTSVSTSSSSSGTTAKATSGVSGKPPALVGMVSAVGPLMHASDGVGKIQLTCHSQSAMPIMWKRLEREYEHTDTATFVEDGFGYLGISPQSPTADVEGVYQCHAPGTPLNDTAEFVVYKEIPKSISCQQEFQVGTPKPGMVFRTTCGFCQSAPVYSGDLTWAEQICSSAVNRAVIPALGGQVTWLMQNNNKVSLLKEENGHVTLIP